MSNIKLSVEHFIITRFNCRSVNDTSNKALDVKWLNSRFDLFDQFCWPSVTNQSNRKFKWIVLFDDETPDVIKERIELYKKDTVFYPVFQPAGTDRAAKKAILSLLDGTPDVLITTRLDNDDALAVDYIERVQDYLSVKKNTVIEFSKGYIWYKNAAYRDTQIHNPFTSLVEPLSALGNEDFSTIFFCSHTDVEKLGVIEYMGDLPGWIQVIHGDNVANRFRGIRCPKIELEGRFLIQKDLLRNRENVIRLNLDTLKTSILMCLVDILRLMKRSSRKK